MPESRAAKAGTRLRRAALDGDLKTESCAGMATHGGAVVMPDSNDPLRQGTQQEPAASNEAGDSSAARGQAPECACY